MKDLTLTQEYFICAVNDKGKLSSFNVDRLVCLLASGMLELQLSGCISIDGGKKRILSGSGKSVSVTGPLPEEKAFLRPLYDYLNQGKPVKMEKILENTYRNINIGLVNELAILCNEMGISMWEVIDAAKTKPYGFQAFYPGPGLGGHCIPLDPYYLSWKAREYGFHTSMIESSMMINDKMPEYCVERASKILNRHKKAMNGAKVLVVGVAYKQDIDDYRESPALRVIEELEKMQADIEYFDPWVSEYVYQGKERKSIPEISPEIIASYDLIMITAAHSNVDYEMIQENAKAIFDTKNVMKNIASRENIEVL